MGKVNIGAIKKQKSYLTDPLGFKSHTYYIIFRKKYPSTLWITIEPVPPPNSSEPTLRSMAPTQPELGFKVI